MLDQSGCLAGALWLAVCVVLLRGLRRVASTQLVWPWAWACLAAGLLAAAAFQQAVSVEPAAARWSLLRYAAVTASLCPTVALFGAKRPQSGPWQFVVLGLWVILMLPALESVVLGHARPDMAGLRAGFMWMLVSCGVANYVATRYGWAAAMMALAQGLLLAGLHFRMPADWSPRMQLLAACLGTTSVAMCHWPTRPSVAPPGRLWLDFRDHFGVVWALRVMVRMNALADHRQWPVRIGWRAVTQTAPLESADAESFRRCFTMLLRSFVSVRWIEQRLESR